MANEFIARNGVIAQNNSTVSGSLTVTQGITGSLEGTASYASQGLSSSFSTTASYIQNAQSASYVLQAVSSSFATTASYALNAGGGGFPYTGSAIITGSLSVIGPTSMTGSLAISSSQTGSIFSVSASYIDFDFDSFLFSGSTTFQGTFTSTATTASFTTLSATTLSATTASLTGSLFGTGSWAISSSRAVSASRADSALSASYALSSSYALTASFALNAAGGAGFPFTGSAVITGSLSVIGRSNITGSVTAANSESLFLVTQTITQTNVTGSKSYQASINPIFVNNAPNQTQTALRINATFTGSQSGSNTQNLIVDFGAANVGSQFTVNDVTSGSIYMVNDVSGLPIIEATSNWDVNIYDYPNIIFKKTGSAIILSSSFTVVTGSGIEFQVTNTGTKIGNASTDVHQVTGSLNITGSVTATTFSGDGSGITGITATNVSSKLFNYYNFI